MVNGRRPPPPSPSGLVTDSRTKDYSGRPSEVTSELDALRNRGIAKGLNRHFTDATRKIAQEKAEADAALADLERRRANKSEFVPSRGGELNPFDSMYVELQAKRAECRRKEKETMLLYQRYVHKYGKKAKVAAPAKEELKTSSPSKTPPTSKSNSPSKKNTEAPQKSAPCPPSSPSKAPLQSLDENSESAVDEDVNFSKFYNKKLLERSEGSDAPGVDPPADPPGMVVSPDPPTRKTVSEVPVEVPDLNEITPPTSEESETQETTAAASNKPDPEESRVVEGSQSESSDESGARPTACVTTEMPSATTATDDDDTDDRSIISGLTTANSVYMTQVMDEIETEMEDFLKTETLAIQQILDSEDEKSMLSSSINNMSMSGGNSVFGDQSVKVAMKAEAMAKEMQKILDDFQKDDKSVSVHGGEESVTARDEDDFSTATPRGYPRKYNVSIPGEEWMVYYDEANQREYFFEKKSNRTQWHPPSSSGGGREDIGEQTREFRSPRRMSRKEQYRKKLRKRRMRRAAVFGVVALFGLATCIHWQYNHPQKSYPEAMKATLEDIQTFDYQGAVGSVKDQLEYTFTDRREREESERERKERIEREAKARRAEEERKAREKEEKERLEKLRAEQKAKEEAEWIAEVERIAAEKKEALRREQQEAERRAMMTQQVETKRPWGCRLPLAGVVRPRCKNLPTSSQKYDESDLLNSVLL